MIMILLLFYLLSPFAGACDDVGDLVDGDVELKVVMIFDVGQPIGTCQVPMVT